MFLNRNLDTGVPSTRLSPTNFYPMLAGVATARQADRMVREHLLNPGRVLGRMGDPVDRAVRPGVQGPGLLARPNLGPHELPGVPGLLNYDQPFARRELARKSLALFNGEWVTKGHVHENYNAITGSRATT
jgi:putative isomerase